MSSLRTFRVLCLAAGLLFVPSGISKAAISLTVNGVDVSEVVLQPGQSCTIEIFSNNNSEYVAYIGFQKADPHGAFGHTETRPQAATFAMVNPFNQPPFSFAYEVAALGGPSPGVHFVFQHLANTPGQVELGLWNSDVHKIDAVSITVMPPHIRNDWLNQREVDSVSTTVQKVRGACFDPWTCMCWIEEEVNCPSPPYLWLGGDTDCSMCPECGACCDNWEKGLCWHSAGPSFCLPPADWLGLGTDCRMCCLGGPCPCTQPGQPGFILESEINQCFQDTAQACALIETKPFVVRVTLVGTQTSENKTVVVKLEVFNDATGEKISKTQYSNPIKVKPCSSSQPYYFFFLDDDTKDMKAGNYRFSFSDAELLNETRIYQFKSSKTVRFLAVETFVYEPNGNGPGGLPKFVRNWNDLYISFAEQVFPVPKMDRKNVNHLDRVFEPLLIYTVDPTNPHDPNKDPENLVSVLETKLKEYNNAHSDAKADFICCVVPPDLCPYLGVRCGNTIRLRKPAPLVEETLGHEMGHIYGLGEEYVYSNKNPANPRFILDQTFRFDKNPPPLKKDTVGHFIIAARRPDPNQLCSWADDKSAYGRRTETSTRLWCTGRFVVPDKAGYEVNIKKPVQFDPFDPNNNTFTMMSGGTAHTWISGPEYRSLIATLAPTAPKSKALSTTAAPLTSGQRMLVSGIIDIPARTAEISPLIPVPNLELSEEAADPNCQLVFKSSTGTVLCDFNIAPLESELPGSQLKGPFSVIVDLPAGTAHLQVTIEGEVAGELQLTDNSPTVSVLSPNGGEQITGEMAITWTASDVDINDTDNLSYTVKFSHDNGTEWSALVMDHDVNELIVDSNYLPGGPNCLVKVIASDGWNRAEDISDAPFSIVTKPPRVTILDPEDGTILLSSESMQGRCTAYDPETGDVNDPNAIVWSSNVDGFLGKGDLIGFELSVGEHILSATAADPEGKTGIDTISVKVLANASDFNCDSRIDFLDLAKFAEKWQATCSPPDWCEGADLDRSGVVDYDDLAELAKNWLWPAD